MNGLPEVPRTRIRDALTRVIERIAAVNRARLGRRTNSFNVGIHAPLSIESAIADLPVTGELPSMLRGGRYLKMGANPLGVGSAGQHWFLGDGMVHQFAFTDDGRASYRNRFIRSRAAAAALGVAPAPGPRRGRSDVVNTNVVPIGNGPLVVVEAGSFPVRLLDGPDGVDGNQHYDDLGGTLRGAFSGHPHRDARTGEWHAIAYDGDVTDKIRHVVVSPAGSVVRDMPIVVRDGPCVHDMAFTQRFAIVFDLPVTFSIRAVLAGHVFPYRWNERHGARLGLLPRDGDGGAIAWCDVAPCFVFHVANAFDRADGAVVADVIAYDTMFKAREGQGIDAIGRLERWIVDGRARRVDRIVRDPTPQEFPRVDDRRFGTPHRFLYTVAAPPDGDPQLGAASSLFKHDGATGRRHVHEFGAAQMPGEFTFVPAGPIANADSDEDDGVLVGLVIDRAADATDLVVLDAARVEAAPIATVRLPFRIPPGFHGNWFAGST